MTTATVEGVEVDTRHWIGGERVASQMTFTDISPIDEQPIAEISAGSSAEVDAAVQAAQHAFAGWAAMPRDERANLLRKVAD
jgi:aminomuconate-semialdehyde/2-hydroxymuconate-6-semialdehyde dehydrogenase